MNLAGVAGITEALANRLGDAGVVTIADYAKRAAEPKGIRGIGPKKAEALEEAVNALWARWARERKEDQTPVAAPEDVPTEGPPEPETTEE